MMIFARSARLPDGWAHDVRLEIEDGKIAGITPQSMAAEGDITVDILLPALANLHSHAFQRAMAGMTEYRAVGQDSFWTWRTLMYRFLTKLTPEKAEAIAALVQMEMLEAGYASVGEFHYVHHQAHGQAFDDPSEMSQRIFSAARTTGIGLTHLPVLYMYGGGNCQPLAGGQLRFGNDVDQFCELVEAAKRSVSQVSSDAQVGIAPHSLRAVSPDALTKVVARHLDGPIHIHIAEQPKEVAEISAWLGSRPVEWVLENMPVDGRWCMVHATHMTAGETRDLARSGAVAGLCPITEANLGDGPFNGPDFLGSGGSFGIGSDSNVRISLCEELRMLEYSQRLRDLARNVWVTSEGSVGEALYLGAAKGGAQALNRASGRIETGYLADLVAIDRSDVALTGLRDDQLLDGFCFAASDRVVQDVWAAGRHVVQGGHHINREKITSEYTKAVLSLLDQL